MARYKVDFTVEAAQLKSAEKLLQKLLGPSSKEIDWKVEKVKTPSNRAERLEEAAAMVSDALAIVEELKDEMATWRDSIPENLQSGDKCCAVDEACSALEEVQGNLEQCEWGVEFPGMMG